MLYSYTGDSKNFSFDGPIFENFYEDIIFEEDLHFSIKLISIENGIHAVFSHLETQIIYEQKSFEINISQFERVWKTEKDPLDGDDVGTITKSNTIDLAPVIREEIIMHIHAQNL